jgi:hypothetical protein
MLIGGQNLNNVFLDYGVLLSTFIILTYLTSKMYPDLIR